MTTSNKVVGPSKTNIVKSTRFVLKTPIALPTKGLHRAVIGEVTNETGMENYVEINRIRVPVILEEKDSKGTNCILDKLPCLSDVKQQLSTSKFDFEVGESVNWQRYDSSRCRTPTKISGEAIPGDCFDWSPPKR